MFLRPRWRDVRVLLEAAPRAKGPGAGACQVSDRIAEIAKRFPGKLSEIEYAAHEIDFRRRIKAALREAVREDRKALRKALVVLQEELLDLALGFSTDHPGDPRTLYQRESAGVRAAISVLDARDAEEGPDYALDSPNHVPQELKDFAARNYERKNRR